MKKILLLLAAVVLLSAPTTYAKERPERGRVLGIKEQLQNAREQLQEKQKELRAGLKETIKALKGGRISGTITTLNGNVLTVTTKENKVYTVNITDKTKIQRRFWGKAQLSELAVGQTVNVVGTWTNTDKTAIIAEFIRNISIQKRFGAFIGNVTAVVDNTVTIQSKNHGTQTAMVSGTTKYNDRNEATISLNDIQVKHRVRIKGTWDNSSNKIYDTTEIKDFSLPLK